MKLLNGSRHQAVVLLLLVFNVKTSLYIHDLSVTSKEPNNDAYCSLNLEKSRLE